MKIKLKDFQAKSGKKVDLKKWPTLIKPYYKSNNDYQILLSKYVDDVSALQSLLYANNHHSLLIIFQGMDASGKDSAIKNIMSGVNPQGCEVHTFKQPSSEELEHDFLWRTTARLPQRGHIGIFNRSYYEEVLIVKIHHEFLQTELLPPNLIADKHLWRNRYRSIINFEEHLYNNGTLIIKFFLHLSKDEQRKRLLKRIDDPDKNWKFNMADLKERRLWNHYRNAYETCIEKTSTKIAPWYIIPADDKNNSRLIMSHIIRNTLKDLKMQPPVLNKSRIKEIHSIRAQLLR